jgi:signal transduction histidine kinase
MNLQSSLLISAVIANLSLGLVVLLRTYKFSYGWYFAGTVFTVGLWGIGDVMILGIKNPNFIRLSEIFFYAAPLFIPLFILLFSLSFANDTKSVSRTKAWLLSLPAIIESTFIIIKPSLLISGVNIHANQLNQAQPRLPEYYLYTLHYSIYFIATYIVLYRNIHKTQGAKKAQLTYTLYGVLIASVPALITNLTLPSLKVGNTVWLGPIFTLIFISSVTFAIVKHRLFDIRLAIVRVLAYVGSLAVLATGFALIVFSLARSVFGLNISTSGEAVISIAAALMALMFNRLKSFFDELSSSLFYQDTYDPEQLIDSLNRVLISTLDLDSLLKKSSVLLANTLRADFCGIALRTGTDDEIKIVGSERLKFDTSNVATVRSYLRQQAKGMMVTDDLDDDSSVKPLLTSSKLAAMVPLNQPTRKASLPLGYILIGVKKSGNPYSEQDYRVLDTIAKELILAIENALRFGQIENFNLTLQEKIDTATKNLRRNNDKLKALDVTKDDFISLASHQLRTPLTSIKGYLSMLNEGDAGKLNKVQKEMIAQAFTSSQRMVYLISDMLNVSRINTGKFSIVSEEVNLADIVDQELSQIKETAASRNLTLTYDKPVDFPICMLDETKIRQVIMNFTDNAIYYTPSGGTIEVKLENLPTRLEFKVLDNGIGVPSSEKHHLFNKFYRAGNARKARPDGTGLGLYMAKKVIIAQGGAIIFDSKEGKGSTFGFIFYKSRVKVPEPVKPLIAAAS